MFFPPSIRLIKILYLFLLFLPSVLLSLFLPPQPLALPSFDLSSGLDGIKIILLWCRLPQGFPLFFFYAYQIRKIEHIHIDEFPYLLTITQIKK